MCAGCATSPSAVATHTAECGALSKLGAANFDTRSLRLFIRLVVARAADCQAERARGTDDDDYGDVCRLVQPPVDASWDLAATGGAAGPTLLRASFKRMTKQVRCLLDAEARLGLEEGAGLLARLSCNTLTLYADNSGADARTVDAAPRRNALGGSPPAVIGCALSPRAAMLNHSCEPNADWQLDADGNLVISATRDVAVDEELCIPYVDTRLPATARRAELRQKFHFACDCRACEAGVARWACALCGNDNGAFDDVCPGLSGGGAKKKQKRCGASRATMAAPAVARRKS